MSLPLRERKRDKFKGIFSRGKTQPSSSPDIVDISAPQSQTATASPPPYTDTFLEETLQTLATTRPEIVTYIQKYATTNIDATIEQARRDAEKQKAVCERKRWPGGDTANKVIRWLDRFKSVGDIIANVDPIHVGLPWAGIRLLLETAVADSQQMTALVTGMDLALYMMHRLQAYSDYYHRLVSGLSKDNLHKALILLYAHVLGFLGSALQIYSQSVATRKLRALWQLSDIADFESTCDRLGARAEIEARNCDRDLMTQWKQDLDATLQSLHSTMFASIEELKVKVDLSKLYVAGEAAYNSYGEGTECLSGTRVDILDNVRRWADAEDGKLIFWLCGWAGTGKSTIARTVSGYFDRHQQRLGASFFFKRGVADRSNAKRFFSTITAQLADKIPQLRAHVGRALACDALLCEKNIEEQFNKLLLEPLASLPHIPDQIVIIVVDALDECDGDADVRLFLKLLAQLTSKTLLRLRIFLTSRPDLPICREFRLLDNSLHMDIVLEDAQKNSIQADIRRYYEHSFNTIREDRLLIQPDYALTTDWPGAQVIDRLVTLSAPLFIFATTVCRFVSEEGSDPASQLAIILEQEYTAGSSDLQELYLPILHRLVIGKKAAQKAVVIRKFREVMGIIVLAAEPVSILTISMLLRLEQQDVRNRLSQLHSVIHVPRQADEPIRLLHLSFREFLLNSADRDEHEFTIDKNSAHHELGQACIERLSAPGALLEDLFSVPRAEMHDLEGSNGQFAALIAPDKAYACVYWPWHWSETSRSVCDGGTIYHFLKTNLLNWLEAVGWLGQMSAAIIPVAALVADARDHIGDETYKIEYYELLQDAYRFMLHHRSIIEAVPSQVYASALMFTSSGSSIRKLFDHHIADSWDVAPRMPEHARAERLSLDARNGTVLTLAFSPDGYNIVSGHRYNDVIVWDASTGQLKWRMVGHTGAVKAVAISGQGTVISGSQDCNVKLWNAKTGESLRTMRGHSGEVTTVAISSDGLTVASGSYVDRTVRTWSVVTGEQQSIWRGHEDSRITGVAISCDGQSIISSWNDTTIRIWDRVTGEQKQKLTLDVGIAKYPISLAVAFSPDVRIFATSRTDGYVVMWDLLTGQRMQAIGFPLETITALAVSSSGEIVAACYDGTIGLRRRGMASGSRLVGTSPNMICAVGISPDGRNFVTGSSDELVRVWETDLGSEQSQLSTKTLRERSTAVAVTADRCTVVSGSLDGSVRMYEAATGQVQQIYQGHDVGVSAVAISHDQGIVVAGYRDGSIQAWNVLTRKLLQTFAGHSINVDTLAISLDGSVIVSSSDMTMRVHSSALGKQLYSYDSLKPITAVAVASDGHVVAFSDSAAISTLDTGTGQLSELNDEAEDTSAYALALSPSASILVGAVYHNMEVRVWNAVTGQLWQVVTIPGPIDQISLSPDERHVLTNIATFKVSKTFLETGAIESMPEAHLRVVGEWLWKGQQRILWMPRECRDAQQMMCGRTLVLRQGSGELNFFRPKEDAEVHGTDGSSLPRPDGDASVGIADDES